MVGGREESILVQNERIGPPEPVMATQFPQHVAENDHNEHVLDKCKLSGGSEQLLVSKGAHFRHQLVLRSKTKIVIY